jgi:hypothetical protein
VQRGQAPCGELKEKMRGCSSGSDTPWSGHAKRSLKRQRARVVLVDDVDRDEALGELRRRLDRLREPRAQVGFIVSRSTTTSIVCLNFLSR